MSQLKQPSQPPILKRPDEASAAASWLLILTGGFIIAGLVFLIYWPAIHGGFLLDDDLLLTDNPLVKAPDGLYRMWLTREPVDYWPVTNTAFWLQWRMWGMNPTGYHVANLLLHVANCLLIWLLLTRLSIPGAFLAALLFAVHPVNVESVAWIAQLKNVLSLLFFLVSIWWYLKSQGTGNRWYWLSLLAFTLAMLSKGSVAVLPVLLLLIVWWQRGRIALGEVWPTIPFFVVAIVLTGVNIWFQARDSGEIIRHATFLQRSLGAGAVIWFYLYKAILPINLAFVYPQWNIDAGNPLWWLPLLAATAVTAWLLYSCWSSPQRKWIWHVLFAWCAFVVALLPVLGFVDIGFMKHSLVADHYLYIALIAVVAIVAAGWASANQAMPHAGRCVAMAMAIAVAAAMSVQTWKHCHIYRDAVVLYQHAVERNPSSILAQNNLGLELAKEGRSTEAMQHYQRALSIDPDSAETYYCLGLEYLKRGDLPKAIESDEQALRIAPEFPEAHYNLGMALQKSGQPEQAIQQYEMAIRLRPNYVYAINNLGNELNRAGRLTEAIPYYQRAIRLEPGNAATHYNLGNALENTNRPAEAVEQYQEALRLDPANADALANLASAYGDLGRSADAIATAQKALEMARSQGRTELVEQIENWTKTYKPQHAAPDAAVPPTQK